MPNLIPRRTRASATADPVDLLRLRKLDEHPAVLAARERPSEIIQRRRVVEREIQEEEASLLPLERESTGLIARGEALSAEAAHDLQEKKRHLETLRTERRMLLEARAELELAEHDARVQAAKEVNLALQREAIAPLKRVIAALAPVLGDIERLAELFQHSVRVGGVGHEAALSQSLQANVHVKPWLFHARQLLASYEYNTREDAS